MSQCPLSETGPTVAVAEKGSARACGRRCRFNTKDERGPLGRRSWAVKEDTPGFPLFSGSEIDSRGGTGACRSGGNQFPWPIEFQQVRRTSDEPLLRSYCESTALANRASAELSKAPVVNGKPSAWLPIFEKAQRAQVALATKLRLSPQSRYSKNKAATTPNGGRAPKPWEGR